MYDGRFAKAKNSRGQPYRAENGNMIEHCLHSFYIYPEFLTEDEYFINLIPESKRKLYCLRGVCYHCGEVIYIPRNSILENEEALEKEFKERIEEIEGNEKCIKKSVKKSRK